MGRAEHVDPLRLDVLLRREQLVLTADLKRQVLDPRGSVLVAAHALLVGQFEEREHVAVTRVEEHVHVGVVFAGRGDVVLRKGGGVVHAEHAAVPFDCLFRVLAAIGGMMDTAELDWMFAHSAGSSACSTPRSIWSRPMLSNSALKLPSPKPSSPLRWMNSKNTGPTCGCVKICSSRRCLPPSVLPSSRMPRDCNSPTGSPCPGSRSSSIS